MPSFELSVALLRKARSAFEVGADFDPGDPPVPLAAVASARAALATAEADVGPDGSTRVEMEDAAFEAFKVCFDVGGEGSEEIADGEWEAIRQAVTRAEGLPLAG